MSAEEIQQAKIKRGQKKSQVTKSINAIEQHIAEDLPSKVTERAEVLKENFKKFEEDHELYTGMLETDELVEESETYFRTAQVAYIESLKQVKAFMKERQEESSQEDKKMPKPQHSDLHKIVDRMSLPQVKLEKFAGDPLNFKSFMAVFDEHVHRSTAEDSMKLSRLLEFTEEDALKAIRHCSLMTPAEGYARAREILEKRFGNHHVISDLIVKQLKSGKQIRSPKELQDFSDDLSNHYATMSSLDKLHEIDTQSCIVDVVNRLQPYLRNRWKRYTMEEKRKNDRYPNFKELVEFITREAEEENDPVCGQIRSSAKSAPAVSCLSSDVSDRSHKVDRLKRNCVACKQDHNLFYCEKFKSMRPWERLRFVKNNKLCENCLMSNHQVSDCRKTSVCTVPGCGLKHTKFIHVTERPKDCNTGGTASVNRVEVKNASMTDFFKSVCVPVVPVIVNDKCHTRCLLDSGSTSSFCTRRLVERLGVKGVVMDYKLSTISNSDECRSAEIVSLNVKSADGREKLKLLHVYVIDSIPAEVPVIDVSHFSHLNDLPISNLDCEVDLLIGQDNAEALIPMDTRKGKSGEPFAVRTLFGWSLNGPVSTSEKVSKHVIANFVSTSQIDENVERLWSIENDEISRDKVGISVQDKVVLVRFKWLRAIMSCQFHLRMVSYSPTTCILHGQG